MMRTIPSFLSIALGGDRWGGMGTKGWKKRRDLEREEIGREMIDTPYIP